MPPVRAGVDERELVDWRAAFNFVLLANCLDLIPLGGTTFSLEKVDLKDNKVSNNGFRNNRTRGQHGTSHTVPLLLQHPMH